MKENTKVMDASESQESQPNLHMRIGPHSSVFRHRHRRGSSRPSPCSRINPPLKMAGAKRSKMQCSKPRQEKETHASPKAAWTAADLTLTATTGLSADTAASNGSRFAFSKGKTRNSGAPVCAAKPRGGGVTCSGVYASGKVD